MTQEYGLSPPQRPPGFLGPASLPVFKDLCVQILTVPPLDWSVASLSIAHFRFMSQLALPERVRAYKLELPET